MSENEANQQPPPVDGPDTVPSADPGIEQITDLLDAAYEPLPVTDEYADLVGPRRPIC